jgi:RNA 3'-terminal phosphate cyclase
MNGRQVQTIANGMFRNGENTVSFKPQGLKAGMYLVTVRTAEGYSTGKVVIE